mmetsp:Transcript_16315/g.24024  ORF Transcript_16315/g.24024 Transcript_16315/m.24024 type:complete len:92 (-) Transcript_16315:265-540(-)
MPNRSGSQPLDGGNFLQGHWAEATAESETPATLAASSMPPSFIPLPFATFEIYLIYPLAQTRWEQPNYKDQSAKETIGTALRAKKYRHITF